MTQLAPAIGVTPHLPPGLRQQTDLTATDLRLSYQRRVVVEAATLSVRPGEVLALVGPNGSGKSTLLRALARLHRPDNGAVDIGETSAIDLSPKAFARLVTLLAQSRPTPTGVSGRDVVGYGRHPHRKRLPISSGSCGEPLPRSLDPLSRDLCRSSRVGPAGARPAAVR